MIKLKGKNPCDVCPNIENCEGCVLYGLVWSSVGECGNDDCFCHYECGCLLDLDDVCKASTCYIEED